MQCLNIAVDIKSDKKNIYSVNPKYYSYYKDKYQQKSVDWLTILSSFSREHLKKHGVQEKHIIAKGIECKTFNQIINTYNYHDLDLLIVDTEGYDFTLVNDFIETVKIILLRTYHNIQLFFLPVNFNFLTIVFLFFYALMKKCCRCL